VDSVDASPPESRNIWKCACRKLIGKLKMLPKLAEMGHFPRRCRMTVQGRGPQKDFSLSITHPAMLPQDAAVHHAAMVFSRNPDTASVTAALPHANL